MKARFNFSYFALLVAFAVLFAASPLFAQVDAGAILGTVTDQSGGAINGAKVVLTNEGTGASVTFTTGGDGSYKFAPVRIGSYKLDVTFQGFQSVTAKGVVVNIGSEVVQNFSLKPGTVSQSIEVTAAAPLLESQDASVGQVVDSTSVNNLPLNGRNFTFLAQLSAGVNSPQADTRGNAASGAFTANGNRPAQNNYLLDGIDNNSDTVDFLNGTNYVVLPPVDAIQEFKVQTSDFSAEFGRSGAAVLNATIKSGTNDLHGSAWEFFRNDKLDAADFFENAHNVKKGALRQNQFGVTAGGPIVIPHVYNGKNKLFFFADYEGLRRVQGTILTGTVPTVAERNSWNAAGATLDLTDYITDPSRVGTTTTDLLGRTAPVGTIFDPATTRLVYAGQVDPVSNFTPTSTGFVRDPFGSCGANTAIFTLAACGLNQLPFVDTGRIDANAIKLLNLFPLPTNSGVFNNFGNSPKLFEHRNSFDARVDANLNDKNQMFFRFSYVDDPNFIPGIFGGIADGGAFQQGPQTALAQQSALSYTHTFSPTLINETRAGFNYLHTTRTSPVSGQLGLPEQYGILDVPQVAENGGLPALGIGAMSTLGSNNFLPSDEVSSTFQLTDNLTEIYGKHTFKMGIEWQHVKFSTLQPPWSHGQFSYGGYTDSPGGTGGNVGIADFLLVPQQSSLETGGINYVGGANTVFVSNIALTDNGKDYYGGYGQDDWKVTSKLTVNLGVRYDFFGLVYEHHGGQANFVPDLYGTPTYLVPNGAEAAFLSQPHDCTANPGFFTCMLAKDGVTLDITDHYGKGLGHSQKANFAPRVGFAYQVTPKLVIRGGYGLFYNGFENRGYSPNIGENYPFQFGFNYFPSLSTTCPVPLVGGNCPVAKVFDSTALYKYATFGPGGTPCGGLNGDPMNGLVTFESGFSCTPLDPKLVNATGLSLLGIQFSYKTPYSMSGNLTVQYAITPTLSVQAAYVRSDGRHLETFPGSNLMPVITDHSANNQDFIPFRDFSQGASYVATQGNSIYQGLQTKVEKRFASGLNFLATYTYSKAMSDAGDLLNGGVGENFRAPGVPGLGIHFDYRLADFDIRNVFHFSGGYELPFGHGKKFASGATGWQNQAIGGWSVNWSATLQGGQPMSLACPQTTAASLGCRDLRVSGQSLDLGLKTGPSGGIFWMGNPKAWNQPCQLGADGVPTSSPSGCVPLSGAAALGVLNQFPGPGFHRLDLSFFKDFPIKERMKLQFRAEIFNLTNHPNFNSPGFGGNGVVAISGATDFTNTGNFGEIGSTRDAPYDPRQIQFALKFYY
jgi:Carboxypeptidase regulatory-like domain/TonB dependent receptor